VEKGNRTKGKIKEIRKGKKAPMPAGISPMLCTLTKVPISDPEFIHEIKWDGYRIISFVNGASVKMHSRGGLDYTKKYPLIAKVLKELGHRMVVDGEVVVLNNKGLPDFDALQLYNAQDTPITYYLFDCVWLDGYDLKELPLTDRKQILHKLIGDTGILKISDSFDDGIKLYEQVINLDLEGIVSKKKDSIYIEGNRGNNWIKTPSRKRQEFVIGGWAESDKNRSFRSLLFGAYNKGRLEWIGRSGGGFKEREMPGILAEFKKLEINESPFINQVLDTKGATIHWVKPKLVANFEFATWTKAGRIRKPAIFLGFRKDKKAEQVVKEIPKPVELISEQVDQDERAKIKTNKKESNWRVLEAIKPRSDMDINMGDCTIKLTDVEKEIWSGVPKAKLIQYYHEVSRFILPHLKDRPLSLHVKYRGVRAPGLYIKDMDGRQPDCADIFIDQRRHPKPGKRNKIDYLVCNNEATLLYMINLGCVDVNPWMSRTMNIAEPDFINIDLDPSDNNFEKVVEAALAAKEVLMEWKLISFVKTSGKSGIHIYIPVAGIVFPEARHYAERLGEEIHQLIPEISTTNVSIRSRGSKLFIDPSQNDYADTLASVYSVRPHKIPSVSTALAWKEIKKGLDPMTFTIHTIPDRLQRKGDLFRNVLSKVIANKNKLIFKKKGEA